MYSIDLSQIFRMDGDDQSDLLFSRSRKGRWCFFLRKSVKIDIPHFHSACWYSTLDGSIATLIHALTALMTPLRLIKIWWIYGSVIPEFCGRVSAGRATLHARLCRAFLVRSTLWQSRPNKAGLKCPSVLSYVRYGAYVRPQKVSLISMKFGM